MSRASDEDFEIPETARVSTVEHRVRFYETDAMGIVHHSNYLRFFENARVQWLDEHDRSYAAYLNEDLHFAVTRVGIDYLQSSRFDDILRIATWMEWVHGASLGMAYRIEREGDCIVTGRTEHAAVRGDGRVRRIPRERREGLRQACPQPKRQNS